MHWSRAAWVYSLSCFPAFPPSLLPSIPYVTVTLFHKVPEELLKPSYILLEPVRYTLAEILRLCRRPMVLPGPLVRSVLQDLLGAVAMCHDRNIVIKSLDAEKVGVCVCILSCYVLSVFWYTG